MVLQHLRDMREDNNLTQTQVANLLHIKQTTYSGYEIGAHNIPVDALIKLADYFNTSIDYLVGRTNNPAPPQK